LITGIDTVYLANEGRFVAFIHAVKLYSKELTPINLKMAIGTVATVASK